MITRPIYLDYNATTPTDPAVVAAMMPYLGERFGNPSSAHVYGYEARAAVEEARRQVASLVGAASDTVAFIGGGSEGDNLAIKGAVFAALERQPHVVSTSIEHSAVLNTLQYLRHRLGADFTLVRVDSTGMVDPDDVRAAIRPSTVLMSVMHANNEVGTIQPVEEIAQIAADHEVLLHVDAAQSAGKTEIDVRALGPALLTLAGHKVYGPKGIGAAVVPPAAALDPLVHGSSQEHGMRAGTEATASIVALGTACEIARESMEEEILRLRALRDLLFDRLAEGVPGLELNGHPSCRLPNTLNVSFPGVVAAQLLEECPEVAASTGSACHAASPEPSPVLLAMGLGFERALGAVRLSLGRWSTLDEIESAAAALIRAYGKLADLRTSAV